MAHRQKMKKKKKKTGVCVNCGSRDTSKKHPMKGEREEGIMGGFSEKERDGSFLNSAEFVRGEGGTRVFNINREDEGDTLNTEIIDVTKRGMETRKLPQKPSRRGGKRHLKKKKMIEELKHINGRIGKATMVSGKKGRNEGPKKKTGPSCNAKGVDEMVQSK